MFPPLNCYGENVGWENARGYKLLTLRQPNTKYDYPLGARILTNNPQSHPKHLQIPVVIIENNTFPLTLYDEAVLMLDGFTNAQTAAVGLCQYYPNTKPSSSMQGIGYIPHYLFDSLSPTGQVDLVNCPLSQTIRDPRFHHIFLPSLLYWLLQSQPAWEHSIDLWHVFLTRNSLFTAQYLDDLSDSDDSTADFFYSLDSNDLFLLLTEEHLKDTPEYDAVVLCRPVKLPPQQRFI